MPLASVAVSGARTAARPPGSKGRRSARPAAVAALWTRTPRVTACRRKGGPSGRPTPSVAEQWRAPLGHAAAARSRAPWSMDGRCLFRRCSPCPTQGRDDVGFASASPGGDNGGPEDQALAVTYRNVDATPAASISEAVEIAGLGLWLRGALGELRAVTGAFAEPSSGLEPETPSLPWRCSTN